MYSLAPEVSFPEEVWCLCRLLVGVVHTLSSGGAPRRHRSEQGGPQERGLEMGLQQLAGGMPGWAQRGQGRVQQQPAEEVEPSQAHENEG